MDKQIKGFFDIAGKTIKESSEKTFFKAVGSEAMDIDAFKEDINRTFNDKIKKIDKYGSIFEVCKFHKYPLEKFVYETKDGYYNTVFHINGPRGSDARTNSQNYSPSSQKPVVLYQHGLLDSCEGIMCDQERSLAFLLVDLGYDVWMNNSRGNKHSKLHRFLDPKMPEYWDFSFQELGYYDQPALIDFILGKTGVKKLSYMGHSQGTSQMFAGLCTNSEFFKQRVNVFIAIAPVCRVDACKSEVIQKAAKNTAAISMALVLDFDFMPHAMAKNRAVGAGMFLTNGGAIGLGQISDEFTSKISQIGMDIFTGHYPAGGSHRQALHFRQSILNKTFQEYDFGPTENMRQYGYQEARDYDFSKIDGVPIALFCGKGDLLASPPNYLWLRDQLEEHSPDSMCFFKEYDLGHMALIIPKVRDCFDDMVALLRKYNHEGIMRPGVSKSVGQAQPCCSMF